MKTQELNELPELPKNTVYNCLKEQKTKFSKKDLRKISNAINSSYKKKFGENTEPDKIVQKEDSNLYLVYCYPEEMRSEMKKIVMWFYKMKKIREKKHNKQVQNATLEKLKKTSPEQYEEELAKINAEAERKKQNYLKTKQQKNKQYSQKRNHNANNSQQNRHKNYEQNRNKTNSNFSNNKYNKPDNKTTSSDTQLQNN